MTHKPLKNQNANLKRYIHSNAHSSIIYYCQGMKATQVSMSRWMDKEDVVYKINGILLSNKKE